MSLERSFIADHFLLKDHDHAEKKYFTFSVAL